MVKVSKIVLLMMCNRDMLGTPLRPKIIAWSSLYKQTNKTRVRGRGRERKR